MAEVATRTVKVDGLDILVREAGRQSPARPSLVLAHGIPSNSVLYAKMLPLLGDRIHAVAFDWPGFGASSKPRGFSYRYRDFAALVPKLLAALDISDPIIGCHDFGGPVMLQHATTHPEDVRGLVIMNTTIYPEHWHPPSFAYWLIVSGFVPGARWAIGRYALRRGYFGRMMRKVAGDPAHWTEAVLEPYFAPVATPEGRHATMKTWSTFRKSFQDIRGIKKRVAACRVPTLIVWGDRDPVLPPANGEAFHQAIKGSEFVHVPEGGHFLQEEWPAAVAGHILEWYGRTKL